MTFNIIDIFTQIFDDLFSFMALDHKFMCEVPESSLNSTEKINTLIGITGDVEGNIMFCFSDIIARDIASKIIGDDIPDNFDIYVKTALTDFFSEFSKRFAYLTKITKMNDEKNPMVQYTVLTSDPTYISGDGLYGMISKVPSRKIFYKINGERFGIAYSLALK